MQLEFFSFCRSWIWQDFQKEWLGSRFAQAKIQYTLYRVYQCYWEQANLWGRYWWQWWHWLLQHHDRSQHATWRSTYWKLHSGSSRQTTAGNLAQNATRNLCDETCGTLQLNVRRQPNLHNRIRAPIHLTLSSLTAPALVSTSSDIFW